MQATAKTIGQQLINLDARSDADIESAFVTIVQRQAGALLVGPAVSNSRSEQIAALAARHELPAMYFSREAVVTGGLISYGTSIFDAYQQAGILCRAHSQGGEASRPAGECSPPSTKPAINLKTAKTLGLDIPQTLLALCPYEAIQSSNAASSSRWSVEGRRGRSQRLRNRQQCR